jgi:putative ABC transport system ATP-binding protein
VARARELLGRVGLADRMTHYPVQLSGGEQQRVALARAFVSKPPLVMADEPTGNLDSANGRHVLDMLVELNRTERTTLLLVTHDRELASRADRLITLHDGLIASDELSSDVSRPA